MEGMGTGLRGYQVPTSVFPPRCAITHNDEIHGEESRFCLSHRTAVLRVNRTLFQPSLSLLYPPPLVFLLFHPVPFPRAFVYYMLNYGDLRQRMQNTAPLTARPWAHASKRVREADWHGFHKCDTFRVRALLTLCCGQGCWAREFFFYIYISRLLSLFNKIHFKYFIKEIKNLSWFISIVYSWKNKCVGKSN